jgi:hypothetical protein
MSKKRRKKAGGMAETMPASPVTVGSRRKRYYLAVLSALVLLSVAAAASRFDAVRRAVSLRPLTAASLAQATPTPLSLAKEYVYAGGRLVATEEPLPPTAPPNAPSQLSVDRQNPQARKLRWADNSGDEGGFKIEMRKSYWAGQWQEIATVGQNVTTYDLVTYKCDYPNMWTYRVRAFNSAGYSSYSNQTTPCSFLTSTSQVENVVWTNLYGVTASGNNLYKSNPASYYWDAGAVSTRAIASGDGYVEITPDNAGTYRMFGLSNGDSTPVFTDIDFAMSLGEGLLCVYEGSNFRGAVGNYVSGDKLRVSVEGGVVKYYKNGTLLYTSTVAPIYPLLLDTSISTGWGNVTNAYISGTLTP